MAGFGPMLGQNHHFSHYALEKIPYAIDRYVKESERLYGVLDDRLKSREYMVGAYGISDMATYPWAYLWHRQGIDIEQFPNVKRWMAAIAARPATERSYAVGKALNTVPTVTPDSKSVLFGQGRIKT